MATAEETTVSTTAMDEGTGADNPSSNQPIWQILDGMITDEERSEGGQTITYKFSKTDQVNIVLNNIRILWQQNHMIDVRMISSDRKEFKYHSVLLAGSSPIFRQIIASQQIQLFQGILAPRDVESVILENLQNCLYKPNEFCDSFAERSQLLEFSTYFGLEEMMVSGILDCSRLLDNWNEMFEQRCLTFTKLEVEGKVFPCHGLILTACSPVLKKLIFNQEDMSMPYNVVNMVDGVSQIAAEKLVRFLYTAELELQSDYAEDVLRSSCKLRLLSAAKGCCKFLKDTLSPDIAFTRRQQAANAHAIHQDQFCDDLFKDVEEFIVQNFQDVIHTDNFRELASIEDVTKFLIRARLDDIEKHTILEALFQWCQHDHDARLEDLSKLYALVNILKEPNGLSTVLATAASQTRGENQARLALVSKVLTADLRTQMVAYQNNPQQQNGSSTQQGRSQTESQQVSEYQHRRVQEVTPREQQRQQQEQAAMRRQNQNDGAGHT